MSVTCSHRLSCLTSVFTGYLVFLLCTLVSGAIADEPAVLTFHVSTRGNDAWSGKRAEPDPERPDGPFRSLRRARDAVRRLKEDHGKLPGPIRVRIRGGTYRLPETLVFEPCDSGASEAPITYAAHGDEKPVLSGARCIEGWQPASDGLWRVELPEVAAGKCYFHQLFVNGRRAVRARGPNEGFYEGQKPLEPHSKPGLFFRPGEISSWKNLSDVDVVVLHHWDASRWPLVSVDEKEHKAVSRGTAHYHIGWRDARRYYVENAFELLDSPGAWYLNRKTGMLHYRPRPGEDMTKALVEAPVLQTLVRFAGDIETERPVEHLRLEGLSLQHADWIRRPEAFTENQGAIAVEAAVEMIGAEHCVLEDCEVAHVGGNAVWMRNGCKHNYVVACHLHDLGAGGVLMAQRMPLPGNMPVRYENHSDKPFQQVRGNTVTDCHIHHGGSIWYGAVGAWIDWSNHNRIGHNHIHDFNYTGISVGLDCWNLTTPCHHNTVDHNHVHDVTKLMADGGGIYTMGDMPGTLIDNNLVHDVRGWRINRGLFLDGETGGVTVRNNIVYHTQYAPMQPYTGNRRTPNTYENNIFALPRYNRMFWNQRADCRNVARHNIVYGVKHIGFYIRHKRPAEVYAELVNHNLYWHPDAEMRFNGDSFAQWQELGFDTESLCGDPKFAAPAEGDFSLPGDSPAFEIGFKPIDMSTVGPRRVSKWDAR